MFFLLVVISFGYPDIITKEYYWKAKMLPVGPCCTKGIRIFDRASGIGIGQAIKDPMGFFQKKFSGGVGVCPLGIFWLGLGLF